MAAQIEKYGNPPAPALVSIIVLNCNGAGWLPRCFETIKAQTIIASIETILVDNCSSDDSVPVARKWLEQFPNAVIVRHSENRGFCAGNNSGAEIAAGRWLFFLNNDTWLEPDCMEKLIDGTEKMAAAAATPLVLNYPDHSYQDFGFYGFDPFGLPSGSEAARGTREIFIAGGCSYLIRGDVFKRVGGFDGEFFIYSDDADLSWRAWIAGFKVAGIFEARLHHRGAAGVNPAGGIETVEFRTTDRKRFLTNRNCLLTLLKNGRHVLLLLLVPLLALLFVESLAGVVLLRRPSFFRASFVDPLRDCWRLRRHVLRQRRFIASFRKHSDWWMLRFLRLRPNRWFEIKRLFQFGRPRVDAGK
ncbi:MAG: glycosyltransferase family 2 protein [Verrucomicrobia bacterium]|nr:glycosyltransferase family 2 protein [Verrucomicrobiota bacterium]MDE3099291.1 glycosyltransferase family 2 protein [Verrucomicrobiota bacterium]